MELNLTCPCGKKVVRHRITKRTVIQCKGCGRYGVFTTLRDKAGAWEWLEPLPEAEPEPDQC